MTPTRISRLYFTTWFLLGAIAIGYFTYLFQRDDDPQMARSPGPPVTQTKTINTKSPGGMTSVLKAKAGLKTDPGITRAISNMHMEMKRLKGSLATMGKENTALKEHVKSLEAAFGPATGSLPKETNKPQPREMKVEKREVSAPEPKIALSTGPMPGNGFAETDLPQSPLPIAGIQAPTRTLFAIQLAEQIAPETINDRWMALKRQHAGILGRLKPRTIKVPSKELRKPTVTLIAGPYKNAASAALACARLIALGTKCKSATFTGTPVANVAAR